MAINKTFLRTQISVNSNNNDNNNNNQNNKNNFPIFQDAKKCQKERAALWIHFKPSLFQHIGTHSSLKGKVQKLKDKQVMVKLLILILITILVNSAKFG